MLIFVDFHVANNVRRNRGIEGLRDFVEINGCGEIKANKKPN